MTVPVSGCRLCSTTHVFYYLPPGAPGGLLESIRRDGLRPVRALPHHPRFVAAPAGPPDAFEQEYEELAGSLPGAEHENGGVCFTTVDFQCLPGTALAHVARIAVPVNRLDPDLSVLTYVWAGVRHYHPVGHEALRRTAELWTAPHLRRWLQAPTAGSPTSPRW
jgi:hypothetical protein